MNSPGLRQLRSHFPGLQPVAANQLNQYGRDLTRTGFDITTGCAVIIVCHNVIRLACGMPGRFDSGAGAAPDFEIPGEGCFPQRDPDPSSDICVAIS